MKFIYLQKIDEAAQLCGLDKYSFCEEFAEILADEAQYYHNNDDEDPAEGLRKWLEDLQRGGCISGMVGAFIYHAQTKEFYIKHLDDLEEFKSSLEDNLGEPIRNRHHSQHTDFMCWLCFEEFCYNIYSELFEFEGGHFDDLQEFEEINDSDGVTVYTCGAWYVVEGGTIVNKVGDSRLLFDGVDLESLRDIDVITACDPIRHGWQLVKLVNF
jgi:hypothetical protein